MKARTASFLFLLHFSTRIHTFLYQLNGAFNRPVFFPCIPSPLLGSYSRWKLQLSHWAAYVPEVVLCWEGSEEAIPPVSF